MYIRFLRCASDLEFLYFVAFFRGFIFIWTIRFFFVPGDSSKFWNSTSKVNFWIIPGYLYQENQLERKDIFSLESAYSFCSFHGNQENFGIFQLIFLDIDIWMKYPFSQRLMFFGISTNNPCLKCLLEHGWKLVILLWNFYFEFLKTFPGFFEGKECTMEQSKHVWIFNAIAFWCLNLKILFGLLFEEVYFYGFPYGHFACYLELNYANSFSWN